MFAMISQLFLSTGNLHPHKLNKSNSTAGSSVLSTGDTGAMPPFPVPNYNWNLTKSWRKKWLVCNIMIDIRNWSSLAAMKQLFTTRKHNTVELPKMHNLQNGMYTFFRGYTHVWSSALYASSPIEIYVTIGLEISVSENEIFVTIELGIFVLDNYTWPLPRNDSEEMGRIHPTYLKKK